MKRTLAGAAKTKAGMVALAGGQLLKKKEEAVEQLKAEEEKNAERIEVLKKEIVVNTMELEKYKGIQNKMREKEKELKALYAGISGAMKQYTECYLERRNIRSRTTSLLAPAGRYSVRSPPCFPCSRGRRHVVDRS